MRFSRCAPLMLTAMCMNCAMGGVLYVGYPAGLEVIPATQRITNNATADPVGWALGNDGTSSLKSVTGLYFPQSVKTISDSAFYDSYHDIGLESITDLTIWSKSLTYIGMNAFRGMSSLENLTIVCSHGGSLYLEYGAFHYTSKLKHLSIISKNNSHISTHSNTFNYWQTSLKTLVVLGNVQFNLPHAFYIPNIAQITVSTDTKITGILMNNNMDGYHFNPEFVHIVNIVDEPVPSSYFGHLSGYFWTPPISMSRTDPRLMSCPHGQMIYGESCVPAYYYVEPTANTECPDLAQSITTEITTEYECVHAADQLGLNASSQWRDMASHRCVTDSNYTIQSDYGYCPTASDITTYEDCEKAANAAGLSFGGYYVNLDWYHNCYIWTGTTTQRVWFNPSGMDSQPTDANVIHGARSLCRESRSICKTPFAPCENGVTAISPAQDNHCVSCDSGYIHDATSNSCSPAVYYLESSGDNTCPDGSESIKTSSECEYAATQLSRNYSSVPEPIPEFQIKADYGYCPDHKNISTQEQCEAAANNMNLGFYTWYGNNMHRGCFVVDYNNDGSLEVYWNIAINVAPEAPQYEEDDAENYFRMKYRAVCGPEPVHVQVDYGYCEDSKDIVTKEKCRAAANHLNLTFSEWIWNEDRQHRGCIKYQNSGGNSVGNNVVYFNEASEPAGQAPQYSASSSDSYRMDYRAVCFDRPVHCSTQSSGALYYSRDDSSSFICKGFQCDNKCNKCVSAIADPAEKTCADIRDDYQSKNCCDVTT